MDHDKTPDNVTDITEKLNTNHNKEMEKAQVELQELQQMLDLQDAVNESCTSEVHQLKLHVSELERTVHELRASDAKPTAGGMKFGALKRRLQELEEQNESLTEENKKIKEVSLDPLQDSLETVLARKTEECLQHQQECEYLKLKLVEFQNELSDIELIRDECSQLKVMLLQKQNESTNPEPSCNDQNSRYDVNISSHHQDQLHNLSLMLTERTEISERYQQECEFLRSKLIEIQNETSDLELIREECKQLKAMLVGKEHESRVDETILMLQTESKQLKHLLSSKDAECQRLQQVILENQNDLSDMELLREECKQIKLMLVNKATDQSTSTQQLELLLAEKDEEILQKNAIIIDIQNSNSDMELLREECNQLKLMLVNRDEYGSSSDGNYQQVIATLKEKEEEIRQKNAVIAALQNSTSDMELLHEECKQLKLMLAENEQSAMTMEQEAVRQMNTSSVMNSSSVNAEGYQENSFILQVQQLEEILQEKDDDLVQKDEKLMKIDEELRQKCEEIKQKDAIIIHMENSTSDMDLLHAECNALKEMITEKELVFIELQKDLDNANDTLEYKNNELKSRMEEYSQLEFRSQEAFDIIKVKERENEVLKEELTENMAQDENIHLLQMEYRNVEERLQMSVKEHNEVQQNNRNIEKQLQMTEKTLDEVQQKLFNAETHCEKLKTYEEQYDGLKDALRQKEEELSSLRLQSSETSILESETVTLLHQQLNELKSLIYERESQIDQLKALVNERENQVLERENGVHELNVLVNEHKQQVNELKISLSEQESQINKLEAKSNKQENIINELTATLEEKNSELHDVHINLNNIKDVLDSTNQKLNETYSKMEEVLCEKASLDKLYGEKEIQLQASITNEKKVLKEAELIRNELKLASLMHADKNELRSDVISNDMQVLPIACEEQTEQLIDSNVCLNTDNNGEMLNNDKVIVSFVNKLKNMMQLDDNEENSLQTDLSYLEISVASCLMKMKEVDDQNKELVFAKDNLQTELDKYTVESLIKHSCLEDKIQEYEQLGQEFGFKIKDLQSQLLEYSELESMYDNKCREFTELQDELANVQAGVTEVRSESKKVEGQLQGEIERLKDQNQKLLSQSKTDANSVITSQCELLREELEKNSLLYLEKTKQCDQLQLEVLKLEENIYELQLRLEQMKKFEEEMLKLETIKKECQTKNKEINQLKSLLEDSETKIESLKKEKSFFEEVTQSKIKLEKEKEELIFQMNLLGIRVQEQDVSLRHNGIAYKEMEAKTSRELERLRNHLMSVSISIPDCVSTSP